MTEAGDGTGAGIPPGDDERRSTPPMPGRAAKKATGTPAHKSVVHEPRTDATVPFTKLSILSQLARGYPLHDIPAKTKIGLGIVNTEIRNFLLETGIKRATDENGQTFVESYESFVIRTAFAAIDRECIDPEIILEGVNNKSFMDRLPEDVKKYFELLETGNIQNVAERAEIEALEEQAKRFFTETNITRLKINNIIHAAAIWKLKTRDTQQSSAPQLTTSRAQSMEPINQHTPRKERVDDHEPLDNQQIKFLGMLAVGNELAIVQEHLHIEDSYEFIEAINTKLGTNSPLEAMLVAIDEKLIKVDTILQRFYSERIAQLDQNDIILLEKIVENTGRESLNYQLAGYFKTTRAQIERRLENIQDILGASTKERSAAIFFAIKMRRATFEQLLTRTDIDQSVEELQDYRTTHDIPRYERERDDTLLIRTIFQAMDYNDVSQARATAGVNLDEMKLLPTDVIVYFTQLKNDTWIRDTIWFNGIAEQAENYIAEHAAQLDVANVVHAAAAWKAFYLRGEVSEISRDLTKAQVDVLKLKARGYSDPKILEELSPNDPTLNTEGAVRTRLTRAYEKLGASSSILAIKRAMDTNIITPEFVVEGYENKLSQLSSNPVFLELLKAISAGDTESRSYRQLVKPNSPFTSVPVINRLVAQIKEKLGTTDIYHAVVVYEAAKRLQLI